MIHIPDQMSAVDIYKVLPKEETYAYAADIWVEGFGNIVTEVPAVAFVPVVIPVVYVKGACGVGGRKRRASPLKASGTAREGIAKIHETFLYGSGDAVVKG